jgi:hypothetical protein
VTMGDLSCDPRSDGWAGRAAASAFTSYGHAATGALGSNGPILLQRSKN